MCNQLFSTGELVTLSDMLTAREQRAAQQLELLHSQRGAVLVSATMNIPGPIKVNDTLTHVFHAVIETVDNAVKDYLPQANLYRESKTGLEYYLLIEMSPVALKKLLVEIEETHPFGRIFDLDVLWLEDDLLHSISRADLQLPPRKCYICQENAKECGRSRRHSIPTMQAKISEIILKGRDNLD